MVSGCDWPSNLTLLQAQGHLPRQVPSCLFVERTWKVTVLKDGACSPWFFSFLSILPCTPTVVGIGQMLYFDDSSVFPESELDGSSLPGRPPSSLQCGMTGLACTGEWCIRVQPGTPWLEFGAWSHSGYTRGRHVQEEIYLYNIYFINLLDVHRVL